MFVFALDLIDKVDLYNQIFDIDDFKEHRIDSYVWLLNTKDGNQYDDNAVFAKELYRIAMEKSKIPQEAIKIYKMQQRKKNLKKFVKGICCK